MSSEAAGRLWGAMLTDKPRQTAASFAKAVWTAAATAVGVVAMMPE